MTRALCFVLMLLLVSPAAAESGIASHYSTKDHDQNGTTVACPGRKLNDGALVAAHRTRPCGSTVKVTNKKNGRSVVVTIIDRGPFVPGRIIDVSMAAAAVLGFRGLAPVILD